MDQRGFVDFGAPEEKGDHKKMLENEMYGLSSEEDIDDEDLSDDDDDGEEMMSDEDEGEGSEDESSDYWSDEGGKERKDYDEDGRWGTKKNIYYGTDYVDDEIISSDDEGLF